ncbi:MAG: CrcB family protein [Terrimesophilobacter sp.]
MNSDIEVSRTVVGVPVVIQLRPSDLGFAALGGALGSLTRYALVQVSPGWDGLSAGTAIVNILGPFLLGVLLQSLSTGQETPRRRTMRLLIGVGFLGALTSYAELALDIIQLGEANQWVLALTYGVGTLVVGAAATWFGIFLAGRHLFRQRQTRTSDQGAGF